MNDMPMRFSVKVRLTCLTRLILKYQNCSVNNSIRRFDILALLRLWDAL